MSSVIVVGGGAAGMLAALYAGRCGHSVVILEQNEKLGKKIYITGKGRCNYSNTADIDGFMAHIVTNSKFLYSALYGFTNDDMTELLNQNGCPTKAERGGRLFPGSDHASDVTAAIKRALNATGVGIRLGMRVTGLVIENSDCSSGGFSDGSSLAADSGGSVSATDGNGSSRRVTGVYTDAGELRADAVILATGGLSYPSTGSRGDGHRMLGELGIDVTDMRPSLVALETAEDYSLLQGLSLRNVTLTIGSGKQHLYSGQGELLFTDRGISGPLALSASAVIGRQIERQGSLPAAIDLKPALDVAALDARLLREIAAAPNKKLRHLFDTLLPGKLAGVFPSLCEVDADNRCNELKRSEREAIVERLKAMPLTICGTGGYSEAVITQGGVSVREIDPSTMAVKKIGGLYCAGELLDVDALTGGYNLQIAFSTGALAGSSIP